MEDNWDDASGLPSKEDFYTYETDLDGKCAWRHFRGKTKSQAYAFFCKCPDLSQEDFMFMGDAAFAYYFSVVERFLLESNAKNEYGEVDEAWILSHCIAAHFPWERPISPAIESLRPRVIRLAEYVRANLPQYSSRPDEQERIDSAWRKLLDDLG